MQKLILRKRNLEDHLRARSTGDWSIPVLGTNPFEQQVLSQTNVTTGYVLTDRLEASEPVGLPIENPPFDVAQGRVKK